MDNNNYIVPNVTDETTDANAADKVVVMPGSAAGNAVEVSRVSPEGTPADAKVGPRGMRLLMVAAGIVILTAAAISVAFIGVAGALVMAAFGIAALVFNPVMAAAAGRAQDRKEVLEHHPVHR